VKRRALGLLCALAALGGCGQYLGDYQVESVRLVRELPRAYPVTPYPEYFEIELSSEVDLSAPEAEVEAVYPEADFCPLRDSEGVIVLGPVTDEGQDLVEQFLTRRMRRQPDGRFHYRLFVVAAHPMPGVGYIGEMMERPRYDLRPGRRDLCLRLFTPGYNLIPSRSGTIRVPSTLLLRAAGAHANPSQVGRLDGHWLTTVLGDRAPLRSGP
jgi:hypothetical protein